MSNEHSLAIRPERPGDEAAIREIHLVAFARGGVEGSAEANLVDALRAACAYPPELSVVAEVEGCLAGHLLISFAAIETATGDVPCLALAPVGVLPGYERLHVGTRLMRHALAEATCMGYRLLVVLGHPKYYRHFGFRPAAPLGIECQWPVASEAFMVLELVPGALEGVRGRVKYHPAFDGF